MAKRAAADRIPPVRREFCILDPVDQGNLGASFGVIGELPDLGGSTTPVITVTVALTTVEGEDRTFERSADFDIGLGTWEAHFSDLPPSAPRTVSIRAACTTPSAGPRHVVGLTVSTVDLELDYPLPYEGVGGPIVGFRSGGTPAPKARGRHKKTATVRAFLTERGTRKKDADEPVVSESQPGSKSRFTIDLGKMVKLGESVRTGRVGLHFRVTIDGDTFSVSRGHFVVKS